MQPTSVPHLEVTLRIVLLLLRLGGAGDLALDIVLVPRTLALRHRERARSRYQGCVHPTFGGIARTICSATGTNSIRNAAVSYSGVRRSAAAQRRRRAPAGCDTRDLGARPPAARLAHRSSTEVVAELCIPSRIRCSDGLLPPSLPWRGSTKNSRSARTRRGRSARLLRGATGGGLSRPRCSSRCLVLVEPCRRSFHFPLLPRM